MSQISKTAIVVSVLLLALLGTIIIVGFKKSESIAVDESAPQKTVPVEAKELTRLINAERVKQGLKPLVVDDRLNESASLKSKDMSDNNYYDHVNPVSGMHGYSYIKQVAPNMCSAMSENLAGGSGIYSSSAKILESWMNSKPHYDAMMSSSYDTTGFGVSTDKNGSYNVVEHFCTTK